MGLVGLEGLGDGLGELFAGELFADLADLADEEGVAEGEGCGDREPPRLPADLAGVPGDVDPSDSPPGDPSAANIDPPARSR